MTQDHDHTRLGGTAVYTEDEAGNRTLVGFTPEHVSAAPVEAEKADGGEFPVPASRLAPVLPATPPAPAQETVAKAAPEQKVKGK